MLEWCRNVADHALEGKTTQQIKQQIEKSMIIAFFIQLLCIHWTRLCDKKFKSNHKAFSAGAGHETRLIYLNVLKLFVNKKTYCCPFRSPLAVFTVFVYLKQTRSFL